MTDDDAVAALALRAAASALGAPTSSFYPSTLSLILPLAVRCTCILRCAGVSPSTLSSSLVVDTAVVRAKRAVSHFALGSAALSPGVTLGEGVYACGDWIDRTGHASWSTDKAVVTARQAATAVGAELGAVTTL